MMLQLLLTLNDEQLLLCGPTRVHLRGRLGETERDLSVTEGGGMIGEKWMKMTA